MRIFLNLAGSACMLAMMAALALACLAAVGWLPQKTNWPRALRPLAQAEAKCEPPCFAPTRREKAAVFAVAVSYMWVVLFVAHWIVNKSPAGAWAHIFDRLTNAGDAEHYIYIAKNWYATAGEKMNLIVFYPLYPFVLGVLGWLSGQYAATGMAISTVCFGLAAVTLLQLAGIQLDKKQALAALAALLLYPFSFFSFGVFTEGLFMLLSLQCLYRLRRRQWLAAGAFGFLAALCRTQGVVLLIPAILCWLAARREQRQGPQSWALLGIPGGYGVYLLCNKRAVGGWMRYMEYQTAAPWYHSVHWVGTNLVENWNMSQDYAGLTRFIYGPQLVLFFLGLGLLAFVLFRRGDLPVTLYSTAYLGMCYLSGWLISGGRYMLGCVGMFLAVGQVRQPWLRRALLVGEGALLLLYAVYYMQGQAIM